MSFFANNKLKTLFIFYILIILNCIYSQVVNNPPSLTETVTYLIFTLDDSPIKVETGSKFAIKIRGNPSAEYGWYLNNRHELNTNIVLPTNLNEYGSTSDYEIDPHPIGIAATGGQYSFTFDAKSSGTVKLIFVNKHCLPTSTNKSPWQSQNFQTKYATVIIN